MWRRSPVCSVYPFFAQTRPGSLAQMSKSKQWFHSTTQDRTQYNWFVVIYVFFTTSVSLNDSFKKQIVIPWVISTIQKYYFIASFFDNSAGKKCYYYFSKNNKKVAGVLSPFSITSFTIISNGESYDKYFSHPDVQVSFLVNLIYVSPLSANPTKWSHSNNSSGISRRIV